MAQLTSTALVISLISLSRNAGPAAGYPRFIATLPNADNVDGVSAIGHISYQGGGPRNVFGIDYKKFGGAWKGGLCMTDSDGDGQTNGEELGDPCCEWSAGAGSTPLWTSGVSHPGNSSSTSNTTLWPSFECPNTTSGSDSQQSSVGDDSSADDPKTTPPPTSVASTAPTVVGLAAIVLAVVAASF